MGIEGLSADIIVDSRSVIHDYGIFQPENTAELVKGLDSPSRSHSEASSQRRESLDGRAVGVGYLLAAVEESAVHVAEQHNS